MRAFARLRPSALSTLLLALTSAALPACSRAPAEAAGAAPAVVVAPPPAADAAMPHGDHSPHHGGTVWMYKDVHFEVVLSAAGTHRIYFSDATRQELPASVATRVTVTIERPRFSPEVIQGAIDDHGEYWIVDGAPVVGTDVSARVAFALGDDHYFIDMPFSVDVRSRTE